MNLRVIHVVTPDFGYNFGGHSRYVFTLLRRWKVAGISLTCFGTDYDFRKESSPSAETRPSRGDSNLWNKSVRLTRMQRMLWAWRLLTMLVSKRSTYDIVHVHVMTWGGLLTPLLCHGLGKKAVYTITRQGLDDPSSVASETLAGVKLRHFKRYDGVIGLSPALVEDCRRHGFSCPLPLLPNFLLLDQLEGGRNQQRRSLVRAQLEIPSDAVVLLFVGSAIERKGIDILVDTFIRLAREKGDLRLVVVGPMNSKESAKIDDAYVAQQRQKLSEAGLADRLLWAGLIRGEAQLADYYHISDVFLLPSRAEGMSNAILEALAGELPVVVTRLEGSTTMQVTPGKTGYLVKQDDLEGFVSATRSLVLDPALRRGMGTAARRQYLEQYGFESYCDKLAAFYRQV